MLDRVPHMRLPQEHSHQQVIDNSPNIQQSGMCASAADHSMLGLGIIQTSRVPCSQEKEQPAFDASEFPALGGGLRGSVGLPNGDSSGTLEGSNNLYANLGMQKGMLPSEFNIQSEEFPALPGANASSRTAGEDRQQNDQQQQQAQSNQVRN